ncbi:hypothetical protein T10_7321 [Trichinella papuae]|uniref:Uncharacterized protein n=1 Tax=Trichinella papuae TaxID=268474 RepID=A0A0V1MIM9_9BILA|nr:hypothetical protein T10_7321 [Trichinella papuae]
MKSSEDQATLTYHTFLLKIFGCASNSQVVVCKVLGEVSERQEQTLITNLEECSAADWPICQAYGLHATGKKPLKCWRINDSNTSWVSPYKYSTQSGTQFINPQDKGQIIDFRRMLTLLFVNRGASQLSTVLSIMIVWHLKVVCVLRQANSTVISDQKNLDSKQAGYQICSKTMVLLNVSYLAYECSFDVEIRRRPPRCGSSIVKSLPNVKFSTQILDSDWEKKKLLLQLFIASQKKRKEKRDWLHLIMMMVMMVMMMMMMQLPATGCIYKSLLLPEAVRHSLFNFESKFVVCKTGILRFSNDDVGSKGKSIKVKKERMHYGGEQLHKMHMV